MRFATGFAALATVAAASLIPASLAHAAPAPAAKPRRTAQASSDAAPGFTLN